MILVFCPSRWWVSKRKSWMGGWMVWALSSFVLDFFNFTKRPLFEESPSMNMHNGVLLHMLSNNLIVVHWLFVDEVVRDFIEGVTDPVLRQIRLTPWQPNAWTHLSYDLHEMDEQFFVVLCDFSTKWVLLSLSVLQGTKLRSILERLLLLIF